MTEAYKPGGAIDFERIADLSTDDDLLDAVQRDPQAAIAFLDTCQREIMRWFIRRDKLARATLTILSKKRDAGI